MSRNVLTDLRALSLGPMAQALQHQMEQPGTYDKMGFSERLGLLLDHELQCRRQRRQQRLIRAADFRLAANLNELDFDAARSLSRSQIGELGQCTWIERGQNLLITGPCGSGKTYVACALGHAACMLNHNVRYFRLPPLLAEFAKARAAGDYYRYVRKLGAVALIIIDDWGLQPLDATDRHDLMELMDARCGRTATAVVSQLPVDNWHAAIGDATLADAILDRLVHNAHRIRLTGESMRKRRSALSDQADPDPGAARNVEHPTPDPGTAQ